MRYVHATLVAFSLVILLSSNPAAARLGMAALAAFHLNDGFILWAVRTHGGHHGWHDNRGHHYGAGATPTIIDAISWEATGSLPVAFVARP